MTRKESYTGPWPRKRHSHTCVTCKRDRDQGAVYCYKSRCARPQQTDTCECCCKLQPSATYRPAAPVDDICSLCGTLPCSCPPEAAVIDVCIAGNPAVDGRCDDIDCVCYPSRHLPACGFLKSGEDQTPCQCMQLRLAAALEVAQAPAAQLDLFGGAR
jgi:hypothetical protein